MIILLRMKQWNGHIVWTYNESSLNSMDKRCLTIMSSLNRRLRWCPTVRCDAILIQGEFSFPYSLIIWWNWCWYSIIFFYVRLKWWNLLLLHPCDAFHVLVIIAIVSIVNVIVTIETIAIRNQHMECISRIEWFVWIEEVSYVVVVSSLFDSLSMLSKDSMWWHHLSLSLSCCHRRW